MQPVDNDIEALLDLERIDTNIFRGQSQDIGTKQVFGGQVLGQALAAAQMTISKRSAHSAHAYFLRKGDFNAPIIYEVDHSRDGKSFSARRVRAIQHGRPIFIMSASFQIQEFGDEYQENIELPSKEEGYLIPTPEKGKPFKYKIAQYFEARIIDRDNQSGKNLYQFWLKMRQKLPDNANLHRSILAYVSDYGPLSAAIIPHREKFKVHKYVVASIDHALWFHRPFRVDEWFYYECTPISTSGARGLARGAIYNEVGQLVASTIQEGLMRRVD